MNLNIDIVLQQLYPVFYQRNLTLQFLPITNVKFYSGKQLRVGLIFHGRIEENYQYVVGNNFLILTLAILGTTKLFCNTAKQRILQWAAQRPILVLILIICFSIILLPAITVAALTPVAMIFTYSDVLMSKGT